MIAFLYRRLRFSNFIQICVGRKLVYSVSQGVNVFWLTALLCFRVIDNQVVEKLFVMALLDAGVVGASAPLLAGFHIFRLNMVLFELEEGAHAKLGLFQV